MSTLKQNLEKTWKWQGGARTPSEWNFYFCILHTLKFLKLCANFEFDALELLRALGMHPENLKILALNRKNMKLRRTGFKQHASPFFRGRMAGGCGGSRKTFFSFLHPTDFQNLQTVYIFGNFPSIGRTDARKMPKNQFFHFWAHKIGEF